MQEKLIVKYSDKLLRELNKVPRGKGFDYAVGKFRGDRKKVTNDILISVGMDEDYYDIIIKKLKDLDFITITDKEHTISTENKTHVHNIVREIKITDIGRHFITNTSFKKEGFNYKWGARVPNIISGIAAAIALLSIIVTYFQNKAQSQELTQIKTELNKKIIDSENNLSSRMDSVLKNHVHQKDSSK
jgi:hypothetical protein